MAARRRRAPRLPPPETPEEALEGTPEDPLQRTAAPVASNDPTDRGIGVPITEPELKRLGEFLADEIQSHLDARQTQEAEWKMWLETYRPPAIRPKKNYPWRGCSNLVVALCAKLTDQVNARILQSIFSLEPHWNVRQRNRAYAEAAKPLERYLDFCRSEMFNQYEAVKPFVLETTKLGTGIISVDWRDEQFYRYDMRTRGIVDAGRKLGPVPRWVAREDFVGPFGYRNPSDMPWCAERMYFDMQQLRRLEFLRQIENLKEIASHPDDESDLRLARRRQVNQTERDMANDPDQGFRTPWKVFFRYDIDNDGYPEDYVALFHLQTKTFLRIRPNPYITSMRTYVVGRFIEVEGEFDGIGVAEMTKDAQDEATVIHNQRRDNAHLSNIRMYKSRNTSTIPDTIRPQNGKVIKMADPKEDLMEWRLSDNRQVDAFEENIVKQYADERVGMNDVNNGQVTSPVGRAAATTIMSLLQEGARRFDLSTSEMRMGLSEEGNMVCELFQTHGLPAANEPGSPESVFGATESEEGAKDASLVRSILDQGDDIRGLVKLQLNVSTAAVNREVEKQSAIQLYQIVSQYLMQGTQIAQTIANPLVPPEVRQFLANGVAGLDKTLKNVFQAHAQFDLETVLVGEVLEQMSATANQKQQMAEQQAAAMGQPPPGAAPPQAPPQPAPPGANGGAPPMQ